MLKVCTAFHRKPGMTVEEYQGYWSREHPAFVRRLPGILGYQQNRPLPISFDLTPQPPYDGLVELWFEDSAALRKMSSSQEYADLVSDEEVFVDRPSIEVVFTSEVMIKAAPRSGGAIKRIRFLGKRVDVSPEAFQDWLRKNHGPQTAADPRVLGHTLSLPRLNGYARGQPPAWDCIEMSWFATLADALAGAGIVDSMVEGDSPPCLYCLESRIISIEQNGEDHAANSV